MPTITSNVLVGRAVTAVREHAAPHDRDFLLTLLAYAPSEKGKVNIANKILHGGDTYVGEVEHWGHLRLLSDFYWRNIVVPVRVTGGRTPETRSMLGSERSSPGGSSSPAEKQAVNNLKSVTDAASLRDRCRCVISGKVDPKIIASGQPNLFAPGGTGFEVTRLTHIVPFSLRQSTGNLSAPHLPSIWGALEAFSGTNLGRLMHEGINTLDNVLTLSATVHRYFTQLQIALEPTPDGPPDTYRVRTWGKVAPRLGLPKTVKLTSANDSPLPDPALLALHCAICCVMWSSGRADELMELLEDLEEVALLAPDGSSANLINVAVYRSLVLADGEI